MRNASLVATFFFACSTLACSGSSDDAAPIDDGATLDGADGNLVDSGGDQGTTTSDVGGDGDASPDATPDAPGGDSKPPVDAGPFDPSKWIPTGKGLWIWYWDYTGLTPAAAATKAKEAGVGWVLIKSGQDGSFWNTRFNVDSVKEFTSRGMRVFAWPYMAVHSRSSQATWK